MFPVITTTLMLFYTKQIRVHTEVLELAFVSAVFDIRDVCCCTDWICTHRGRKNKIFILKKKQIFCREAPWGIVSNMNFVVK